MKAARPAMIPNVSAASRTSDVFSAAAAANQEEARSTDESCCNRADRHEGNAGLQQRRRPNGLPLMCRCDSVAA